MSKVEYLCGKDLLKVLDETRSPLVRVNIRNKALTYLHNNADRLPSGDARSCKDLVKNFNTGKHISDQLRDLAVWVDEVNARIEQVEKA